MQNQQELVVLNKDLVLSKEGFDDLVYEKGLLLKVEMRSNDHVVVVTEDGKRTFILKEEDRGVQWDFL